MVITTDGCKGLPPLLVLMGLILLCAGSNPQALSAQSQSTQANGSTLPHYSTEVLGQVSFSRSATKPEASNSGTGLTIVPTFDTNPGTAIDAPTQTVINNAIAFYQTTFTVRLLISPTTRAIAVEPGGGSTML